MTKMVKINILALVLCSLILCCSCSSTLKELPKPNIIYVLADDMGYGDVSRFNPEGKIETPHLDKMAKEGMIFTDAHTSSAVCTPTRYGILTGRYNWRSTLKEGVLWGKSQALIPKTRTTVGSMLQSTGYHTAFIGKWHLGWNWSIDSVDTIDFSKKVEHSPNTIGFDYAYGHAASLDIPPYVYVENGMATSIPTDSTVNTGEYSWWRKGLTAPDFVHEEVTPNFFRRAFNHIKKRAKEENPFFLYLALPSPHTPILPTAKWQNKSGLNAYGDFVMQIDAYMGQLAKVIKEAGIENNTMVIFTSDNGCSPEANFDGLNQKGHDPSYIFRGHKADIFEGGHRVPFIVKWPNGIKKGSVSDDIICTTDLMATCAEIVGYSLSDTEGEDSYSLVPLFENEKLEKPIREATVHHSINGSFAIRQGKWKLILSPGSGGWSDPRPNDKTIDSLPKFQIYDLENDPSETSNQIAANPEKVAKLRALLTKYIVEGRSTPGVDQKNDSINFDWKQIEFIGQ